MKLCHVFFHACSIPCIVIGFLAVWESKNESNIPHFYSLHSWLGLITSGLFAFQFVLGFFRWVLWERCWKPQRLRPTENFLPLPGRFLRKFLLAWEQKFRNKLNFPGKSDKVSDNSFPKVKIRSEKFALINFGQFSALNFIKQNFQQFTVKGKCLATKGF